MSLSWDRARKEAIARGTEFVDDRARSRSEDSYVWVSSESEDRRLGATGLAQKRGGSAFIGCVGFDVRWRRGQIGCWVLLEREGNKGIGIGIVVVGKGDELNF